MGRKVIAFWLSLMMALSFIVVLDVIIDFTPPVKGGIIRYVNETGTGGAYTKIQDAINASSDGDTVFVYNGTYYENVIVNKTINLTGENRNTTIIDGDGNGDVVQIDVDLVNLTGFKIINSNNFDSGIKINSKYNIISSNDISSNYLGISLSSLTENNTISHNNFSNNNRGIQSDFSSNNTITNNRFRLHLDIVIFLISSSYNDISENLILNNDWGGIYLSSSSNNNSIYSNNISFNEDYGIDIYKSSNNTILINNITVNNGTAIILRLSSNNTISNNVIFSNNNGISITGSFNDIYSNNISLNKLDGVYVSSNNNSILDNNIISNNNGLYLSSSSNNIINNNMIINNSFNGIRLASWSENNTIFNNTIYSNGNYGIFLSSSSNNNIMGNNVLNSMFGIYLDSSSNNTITSNIVCNNSEDGIYLDSSHINNITSNMALSNWHGVYLVSSDGNYITDNNASSNNYSGIWLWDSCDNNISGNSIFSNNMRGIFIRAFSSENNIISNTLCLNTYEGIYLEDAFDNNIIGNDASNNSDGIFLSSSGWNNITGNNFFSNSWSGILIAFSSSNNNTIANNNVYLNENYGIYLEWASNNRIYHNNIMGNTNQAYDGESNNLWNNTYPSGGNYWGDLFHIADQFSGPLQNIPGLDGINDSAYIIDSDSQDNYPLVKPIGNLTFLYEGWNLISIPFIQSNTNLGNVLFSIKGLYTGVQWYDASDPIDAWKHNCSLKPPHLNDLNDIDHLMGFWIYITKAGGVLFEYFGIEPIINQTITLHPGWNQVGYPSLTNYNRTKGLNNLTFDTHIDAIWTYNAANQKWKEFGPLDYFEIGRGYWVHAKTSCEWEVPL